MSLPAETVAIAHQLHAQLDEDGRYASVVEPVLERAEVLVGRGLLEEFGREGQRDARRYACGFFVEKTQRTLDPDRRAHAWLFEREHLRALRFVATHSLDGFVEAARAEEHAPARAWAEAAMAGDDPAHRLLPEYWAEDVRRVASTEENSLGDLSELERICRPRLDDRGFRAAYLYGLGRSLRQVDDELERNGGVLGRLEGLETARAANPGSPLGGIAAPRSER